MSLSLVFCLSLSLSLSLSPILFAMLSEFEPVDSTNGTSEMGAGARASVTQTFDGCTGDTLAAALWILKRRRPLTFFFENVKAIMIGNGHLKVIELCEEAGYICIWRVLNPRMWGIPQDRPRVYFLGRPIPA